jgi:hypothetical protein
MGASAEKVKGFLGEGEENFPCPEDSPYSQPSPEAWVGGEDVSDALSKKCAKRTVIMQKGEHRPQQRGSDATQQAFAALLAQTLPPARREESANSLTRASRT